MNDFLPSRKVVAFVLVPVVTILALWMINRYYAQTPEPVVEERNKLEVALEEGEREFQELDTDKDGLKDWEEFLYQTDERNPDTDGDGSSDGLEVKKGFDPLVAGAGSEVEVASEKTSGVTFYKNDPTLTKTDLLARDIFVAYRELKEGESLDISEIREQAIKQSLTESTNVQNTYVYSESDIKTVTDTSFNKSAYTTSYSQAARELDLIQFTELELFARYIDNEDAAALQELIKNKERYEAFAKKLSEINVPQAVSQVHLELINNLMIYSNTIGSMTRVSEDPLTAIVGMQKLVEDEELIVKNFDALSLYITGNNL